MSNLDSSSLRKISALTKITTLKITPDNKYCNIFRIHFRVNFLFLNLLKQYVQSGGEVLSVAENILIDPSGIPKECLPYIQVHVAEYEYVRIDQTGISRVKIALKKIILFSTISRWCE
jgi:hypothetical protein